MHLIDIHERLGLAGFTFPDSVDIDESVDTHMHARNNRADDDGRMEMVIEACDGEHEFVTAIGNSNPAILTGGQGLKYVKQGEGCRPKGSHLKIKVSILVTDDTDPEMIKAIRKDPRMREAVQSLKVFFGGVSNDYGNNVSNIQNIKEVLHAAADPKLGSPLPVTFHAERAADRNGKELPLREREWYCVENDIVDVFNIEPRGMYVIRHVSDGRTMQLVRHYRLRGINVHVEISPQYCLMVFEDLFALQAFHGHLLCWPVAKDEWSRRIILDTALECPVWCHFATDFAMHVDDITKGEGVKITCDGDACGGLTFLPWLAKSVMIQALLRYAREHKLDNLLSGNARGAYGLPPASQKIRYHRKTILIPEFVYGIGYGGKKIKARVFQGGQKLECYVRAA